MPKITKDDIGRLEFYLRDLRESMAVYDTNKNNKLDIRATVEVWKGDIAVAYSLIRELMEEE